MRRSMAIVIGLLFVSSVAAAADIDSGKTQLSIFSSNLGWEVSHNETTRTGGIGLALSRALTRNWSAEIKVAQEQHFAPVVYYTGGPASPIITRVGFYNYPLDLLAHYRFANSSRWTPYVNAGFRYVSAPKRGGRSCPLRVDGSPNQPFGSRSDLQVGVGTDLRITRHFGLRFDANRLVRAQDVFYDPLFRPSVGAKWSF